MDREINKVRRTTQSGFTLIELMIVVAIVGILAAVAIPSYQDYIDRARMTEVMASIDMAKTTIAEDYMTNAIMPPAPGGATPGILDDLQTTMAANSALITTVVFARLDDNNVTGTISLNATQFTGVTGSSDNSWVFQVVGSPNGVTLVCSTATSTVLAKLRPANCR